MKAYAYNIIGEYIGEVDCQPNPLELGEFIVPAQATTVEPPKQKPGKVRTWNGKKWVFIDIVIEPTEAAAEETSSTPIEEASNDIAE